MNISTWQDAIARIPEIPVPRITASEPHANGRFCRLEKHAVVYPDGTTGAWESVSRPERVVQTLAVTPSRALVLVAEYRMLIAKWVIAMPAGLVDAGQTPEEAALRELREEVGYTGEFAEPIISTPSSSGMTTEVVEQYLVKDAYPDPRGTAREAHEFIETLIVPVAELRELMQVPLRDSERFTIDSKIFSALAYAGIRW